MPTYSYICPLSHEYEEVLPLSEYQKETKCPKCKKAGKRVITMAQREPTFSDKIYPYWDKSLNKIFQNRTERSVYMKKNGIFEAGNARSTYKQEQKLMKEWRVGRFDPRLARNVLRD